MLRLMKYALAVAVVFAFTGCTSKNVRPKTAVEFCERLQEKFDGKTECVALTDADKLTMLQAVEGAVLVKQTPDGKKPTEIAWVAYTDPPKEPTLGGLLHELGRGLAGVALLEEHNDTAKVGVYVVRGELGAEAWASVGKIVRELQPREQPRLD